MAAKAQGSRVVPRPSKKRVCVLGLDGLPYSLVQRLTRDGTMPNLAELTRQGHLHRMKVTLPEISSVSWTSFMTGAGPGTHGVFGFVDLKPGTREIRFPGFRDVRVPTLWDRLGKKGKRSVVLNQPATYPARPIPGVLVSGFVAIELRKAVYPPSLCAELERLRYELDIDTERAREDTDFLLEALDSSLQGRRAALDLLWQREEWDYFQVVLTGTDRLQHYLWRATQDDAHPYHPAVQDYYRKVDGFIGEVVDRFQNKVSREQGWHGLFLLSDHGFTGIEKEFNLNTWLQQEGYQRLCAPGQPSLAGLSSDTRAFALEPNRIYFNRQDRFADGCVGPAETDRLAEEIAGKLLALRCGGRPVVQRVIRCGEFYSGPQTPNGPDLIVLTHYGYDAKGALGKDEVLSSTDLQGMHTWDDAFFWAAEKIGEAVHIEELASLIEAKLI